VAELETIAARDPVLAGSLIQVANSAIYGPGQRIGAVRRAIAYIGTVAARHVLLAAVMRPLFATAGLTKVWNHAVQMAQLTAALAEHTENLEAGEGLLLGLVHDVGAIAVQVLPGPIVERYHRLTEDRCCPPTYVEYLLFGRDHGEIGAGVLEEWSFPAPLIEAVRFHHRPERSDRALASLLHLAEFWSGQDEDIASLERLDECRRRTGISFELLETIPTKRDTLSLLRSIG
jgi:HD-like signal output (HDOD) protein